jgi:ribosomal protein L37AE/L43A
MVCLGAKAPAGISGFGPSTAHDVREVTAMTELETTATDRCPFCGLEKSEWTENEGDGVIGAGVTYCSQECLLKDQARG